MSGLRVSDLEREALAARLRDAAGEGRLTMDEADQRQRLAYGAQVRVDLTALAADLPEPEPDSVPRPGRRAGLITAHTRRRLAAHAVLLTVLAALLVTRWALDPASWFWPGWPLFGLSLLIHHRRVQRLPHRAARAPR